MRTAAFIFFLTTALLLLIVITGVLLLWARGTNTLLLPGLGILIAFSRLLGILMVLETIVVVAAFVMWRA